MIYKEYGKLIRDAREDRGLQQLEVANHVGVSQSMVSSWETGKKIPSLPQVLKLRDLLDVSVGDLLGVGLAMVDDVERAIVNSKLPPDAQDVVLTVYGHLSGQDSLGHAAVLRTEIPQAGDTGKAGPGGPVLPA